MIKKILAYLWGSRNSLTKKKELVVPPNLKKFLAQRKFEDNKTTDFSTNQDWKIDQTKVSPVQHKYSFTDNQGSIKLYIRQDDFYWKMYGDSPYDFISIDSGERKYKYANAGIMQDKTQLLIYPYFYFITYFKALKVFICSTCTDNYPEDFKQGIFDLYYFDTKGRFLYQEQGNYMKQLPSLAFLDNDKQEIIKIAPLPEGFNLKKIIRYDRLIIRNKTEQLGIADHLGNIVLDCRYEKIICTEDLHSAFLKKESEVYQLKLSSLEETKLPYHDIIKCSRSTLSVQRFDEKNDRKKWGMIDLEGKEILPTTYDFLEANFTSNQFKFFEGNYNWIEDDKAEALLEEYVDAMSHKMNELFGRMGKGKWGIVDEQGEIIIPPEYDWIEEFTKDYYLVNLGCDLIYFYYGDGRFNNIASIGGKWGLIDKQGKLIEAIEDLEDFEFQKKYMKKNNSKAFYKYTGSSVMKIKRNIT